MEVKGEQRTERGQRWSGEEADCGVGAWWKDPGLCGVKGHIQDAQVVGSLVTPEHLHWDDEGVLEQVAVEGGRSSMVRMWIQYSDSQGPQGGALLVDGAVADDDGTVVGGGGEQRVGAVEGHTPHRLLVVSAHRERRGG